MSQITKLTKEQLVSALRDAAKRPSEEGAATSRSSPTISIDAFDKLLKERLDPLLETISTLTKEMQELRSRAQKLQAGSSPKELTSLINRLK